MNQQNSDTRSDKAANAGTPSSPPPFAPVKPDDGTSFSWRRAPLAATERFTHEIGAQRDALCDVLDGQYGLPLRTEDLRLSFRAAEHAARDADEDAAAAAEQAREQAEDNRARRAGIDAKLSELSKELAAKQSDLEKAECRLAASLGDAAIAAKRDAAGRVGFEDLLTQITTRAGADLNIAAGIGAMVPEPEPPAPVGRGGALFSVLGAAACGMLLAVTLGSVTSLMPLSDLDEPGDNGFKIAVTWFVCTLIDALFKAFAAKVGRTVATETSGNGSGPADRSRGAILIAWGQAVMLLFIWSGMSVVEGLGLRIVYEAKHPLSDSAAPLSLLVYCLAGAFASGALCMFHFAEAYLAARRAQRHAFLKHRSHVSLTSFMEEPRIRTVIACWHESENLRAGVAGVEADIADLQGERERTFTVELPEPVAAALREKQHTARGEAIEARAKVERYVEALESLRGLGWFSRRRGRRLR